jgi:hypothetical protein
MRRLSRRAFPVVAGLAFFTAASMIEPPASRGQPAASSQGLDATSDMADQQQIAPLVNRPGRFAPNLRSRFLSDYLSAPTTEKRAVFKRYLSSLGADGILDMLEMNPLCHTEAHDLGKEVFARLRALAPAMQVCANRCTSGCFHGILTQAFLGGAGAEDPSRHLTLEEMKPKVNALCSNPALANAFEAGNCAHGVGHAILIMSGYDLGAAARSRATRVSHPLRRERVGLLGGDAEQEIRHREGLSPLL